MRLVIVGGSGSATPELADALAEWPGGVARRPALDIVLAGRRAERLALVAEETRRRADRVAGPPVTVRAESDLDAALRDADVVVNAVRIGGLAARDFDETFPRAHGIPGEETMGPGGFANARRTVPAVLPIWERVANLAPDALHINLTNPSGIVVAAIERVVGLRVVSVCDSPATFTGAIARRLDRPLEAVRLGYSGMNHVGWWTPDDAADLETVADLGSGLDPAAVAVQGALGAAYVRYYVHPDRILARQQAAPETRARELQRLERELIEGYAEGSSDLPRRGAAWYAEAVLPLIDAWTNGSHAVLTLGLRNDGRIDGVAADVITEGPFRIPAPRRLEPVAATPLPPQPAALLAAHADYERLAVEATLPGAPRDASLAALMVNPLVSGYDRAAALLEAIEVGSPA